jgi:hypothetical protein
MNRILLLAGVFLLALAAVSRAGEPDAAFLKSAEKLAAWIDDRSDFGAMPFHPAYIFVPKDDLKYITYQSAGIDPDSVGGTFEILASYYHGVMWLSEDFDIVTDAPILLHELVHHLQFIEGRVYSCSQEQELEAYDLHNRYARETGATDLVVDAVTVMLVSMCPPTWEDYPLTR